MSDSFVGTTQETQRKGTNSMTESEELRQDTIEKSKLSSCSADRSVGMERWVDHAFDLREHERMLTDLSELHDSVVQALDSGSLTGKRCQVSVSNTNKQVNHRDSPLRIMTLSKQHPVFLHLSI